MKLTQRRIDKNEQDIVVITTIKTMKKTMKKQYKEKKTERT